MDYRPPSFRQPQDVGPISLDGIFEAYQKNKMEREQMARQGFEDTVKFGAPIGQMTPEQLGRALSPVQNMPATPGGFNMPGTMIGSPNRNMPAQIGGPQFDQDPHVAAIQRFLEQKRAGEARGVQKDSLGMDLTRSEIEKNRAMAQAARRGPGRSGVVGPDGQPSGKMLPPASVLALNEGAAVARQLPDVAAALKEASSFMGPAGGRLGTANPYDEKAQTIDARFRTASQSFGRFMEGGVLRKEDEEKYRKMFPQLSDTPEVAKNKLSIVQRLLAQKYESDKGALGGSGYDVSGFGSLQIPESLFDGGGKIRVSNGKETLLIDPADAADAEKDGYRRL